MRPIAHSSHWSPERKFRAYLLQGLASCVYDVRSVPSPRRPKSLGGCSMEVSDTKEPASVDKPPVPKGIWGTILTTTPIVLTVLATAFAGLSSSEMTQAMYHRSLAAQHQSKAGDQWAFAASKNDRRTTMDSTYEL